MENRLKNFDYNRWLIAFIVIGLLAALFVDVERYKVEEKNMTVEMVIDYEGLVELAEIEGLPPESVLKQAKEAGITSLAVYETTFKKLNANGKVQAIAGSEVLKSYYSGTLVDPAWRALVENGKILADAVYVTQHDGQTFREVKEDLVRRLGQERVESLTVGSAEVLAVKANYEKLLKMNLGMPTDEMRAANAAGFYVVARPSNYQQATDDDVRAVFSRLNGFNISAVVFSGDQVLGNKAALTETARLFKERQLVLGLIEHPLQLQFFKQDGLMELARQIDFKAARVYSIPKDEQVKMKLHQAIDRWTTTDEERNIRINLLRTFEKPEGNMSLLETNMTYFSQVRDTLNKHGFTIGKAQAFDNYYPNRILLILMSIGAAAAGILYLTLIRPFAPKYQYILLVILGLILAIPLAMGHGNMVRSMVALASANLFPALAVIWQLDRIRMSNFSKDAPLLRIIGTGVIALFVTGALSFVGAAYVGGVLADVEYFLEVNIFRGVKLTFVMPIILVSIAFLQRFNLFDGQADHTAGIIEQIKKILNTPIYVKSLAAFGFAAIAALIFVGRSGHTAGVPVPGIELKFRAFLEQAMYARPRSKELLIGHPAFLLAIMSLYKKWPTIIFYALIVMATIGQGSLVETFAHVRTPIFMSFMRGLGGIILGAGIGVGCMLVAHVWHSLASRRGGCAKNNE